MNISRLLEKRRNSSWFLCRFSPHDVVFSTRTDEQQQLTDYAFSFFLQTKMWWSERYDDVARQLEIAIVLLLSRVFEMCLEATMQHFVMWDCGTKRFFNWSFKYLNSSTISANSWRKVTCESFDKRKIHIAVLHIRFI